MANRALWNVLTPKEVIKFIKSNREEGMGEVTKLLTKKVKEIYKLEGQPMPDITIILQYLHSATVHRK